MHVYIYIITTFTGVETNTRVRRFRNVEPHPGDNPQIYYRFRISFSREIIVHASCARTHISTYYEMHSWGADIVTLTTYQVLKLVLNF